jgi:hypothetical protein
MNKELKKSHFFINSISVFIKLISNIFLLPFLLFYLNSTEIGFWYLLVSISSLVHLLDFGFSPSIEKNLLFAYNGADKLFSEGFGNLNFTNKKINVRLFRTILITSNFIYLLISIVALIVFIIFGLFYLFFSYNSLPLIFSISWIVYSIGAVVIMRFALISPLLRAKGKIKENGYLNILQNIIFLIISIILLIFKYGLLGISISYFFSSFVPVVFLIYETKKFHNFNVFKINKLKKSSINLLIVIWPNMKKLGLVLLGSWLINRSIIIISSMFLDLTVVGMIGLTIQLLGILGTVSTLFYNSYSPLIISKKFIGESFQLKKYFSFALLFQWVIGIVGIFVIYFYGQTFISLFSNNLLLSGIELLLLSITLFLEWNHSTFANYLSQTNRVPFTKASIISGITISILSYFLLGVLNFGVFGIIFSQFFVQILYNNWKWPLLVMNEEELSVKKIIYYSFKLLNEIF